MRTTILWLAASLLWGTAFGADRKQTEPVGDVLAFDYFANNWNVIGLKDYKFGGRITPNNELVLAGKMLVEIRIGADRTPLSRKNPKLAMDGWMPIIAGYTCRFTPRPVRYIRVIQPHNSANTGRHLVEVMAFAQ